MQFKDGLCHVTMNRLCLCGPLCPPPLRLLAGLLPYYFEHLRHGELSLQVDECVYNNMFDSDRCRGVSRPYIKNIHFTICDKPWSCTWHEPGSACEHFTDIWFDIRHQVCSHPKRGECTPHQLPKSSGNVNTLYLYTGRNRRHRCRSGSGQLSKVMVHTHVISQQRCRRPVM